MDKSQWNNFMSLYKEVHKMGANILDKLIEAELTEYGEDSAYVRIEFGYGDEDSVVITYYDKSRIVYDSSTITIPIDVFIDESKQGEYIAELVEKKRKRDAERERIWAEQQMKYELETYERLRMKFDGMM